MWSSRLEVVNKVLEETILKASYAEQLIVIKVVESITRERFLAEVSDIRRFGSPK